MSSDSLSAQFLTFSLGEEVFAIAIDSVREIIQHAALTVVPLMPEFVRGVMNLRGAVVPVIDLRARLGRTRSPIGKKTCVVVFDARQDGEKAELGLLVDAVSEVIEIRTELIESAPQFGATVRRDFMRGMGKVNGNFIVILDSERVLNIDDMALSDHATE